MIFQETYFIHCVKPNEARDCQKFDDYLVNQQVEAFGIATLLNLFRNGYSSQLPYDLIVSKFAPYISNKATLYSEQFCRIVLCAMGCDKNCFVLGKTQIFLRPKNEDFANNFKTMNIDDIKAVAKKVNEKFNIHRRHSLWINFRFVGRCAW